jgi:hypothetical protein
MHACAVNRDLLRCALAGVGVMLTGKLLEELCGALDGEAGVSFCVLALVPVELSVEAAEQLLGLERLGALHVRVLAAQGCEALPASCAPMQD